MANDLHVYASLYQNKQLMLGGPQNAWRDEQLQRVLAGEVNAWIPDLLPERGTYLEHQRNALMNYCDFLSAYAQQQGRERWGCKMPGWPVPQLSFLLGLLPEAKVIYIHRDIEECVISARTINMCLDEPSTQQFRQFYTFQQAEAERRLRNERVMWINYRELVEQPAPILERLANFTGAEAINAAVMEHRVGNYG